MSHPGSETELDLRHLRRSARTALELAVLALAPQALLDSLAVVTGLLEAVEELPRESPTVAALLPHLGKRAETALSEWEAWHAEHLAKLKA